MESLTTQDLSGWQVDRHKYSFVIFLLSLSDGRRVTYNTIVLRADDMIKVRRIRYNVQRRILEHAPAGGAEIPGNRTDRERA